MKYTYIPRGVCPTEMSFEIEDGIISNIAFTGGCNGNLKALSKILDGKPVSYIQETLAGNTCGSKPTSCMDQLTKGIAKALKSDK